MTTDQKWQYLKGHYKLNLLSDILDIHFPNNKKLFSLFESWYVHNMPGYTDTSEGILMIELLYNITKNNSK